MEKKKLQASGKGETSELSKEVVLDMTKAYQSEVTEGITDTLERKRRKGNGKKR